MGFWSSALLQILVRPFRIGDETLIWLSSLRVVSRYDPVIPDLFFVFAPKSSTKGNSSLMSTCDTPALLVINRRHSVLDPIKVDARCVSTRKSTFDHSILHAQLIQYSNDIVPDELRRLAAGCGSREQAFETCRLRYFRSRRIRNGRSIQCIHITSQVSIGFLGDVSLGSSL